MDTEGHVVTLARSPSLGLSVHLSLTLTFTNSYRYYFVQCENKVEWENTFFFVRVIISNFFLPPGPDDRTWRI